MKSVVQVLRQANTPKQVVMFPFGGGSGYSFVELIHEIDRDAQVIVVNPPGHLFNGGKPLESIEAMVYIYAKELRPLLKDNCLLFGHSIGGLVAYELCKDLEREMNVKKLIISSVNPPHRTMDDVDLHSGMDTPQLIQKCTALGGMPAVFREEPELLETFISGLRADLKALERYTAGRTAATENGKLKTGTLILYGDDDYIVAPAKLQEWGRYLHFFECVEFPGDHFYLFHQDHRRTVGRLITQQVNL